jgi:hypothetical protein
VLGGVSDIFIVEVAFIVIKSIMGLCQRMCHSFVFSVFVEAFKCVSN